MGLPPISFPAYLVPTWDLPALGDVPFWKYIVLFPVVLLAVCCFSMMAAPRNERDFKFGVYGLLLFTGCGLAILTGWTVYTVVLVLLLLLLHLARPGPLSRRLPLKSNTKKRRGK